MNDDDRVAWWRSPRLWAVGFGLLLAASFLFWVNPTQCRWLPSCAFHKLTGLYCPGCGSTRALHALLHGDVLTAMRFNILAVIGLPVLAILACWRRLALRPVVGWGALVIAVLFGILRNLPLESLQVLRP
jgi:hypothetical protein